MVSKQQIMAQRIIALVLITGLSFATMLMVSGTSEWRWVDNQQGYAPEQPIAYSHRLHAGDLQIDCKFCHVGADSSRYAGIPAADVCMKCHKYVTASFDTIQHENKLALDEGRDPGIIISPELQKLYDYLGLDEWRQPKEDAKPSPIPWVRIHDLPDYVKFNHQAHVAKGVACQHCHGPVETMERVHQFSNLSMGWCVNCHRETKELGVNGHAVNPSVDCTVCHY